VTNYLEIPNEDIDQGSPVTQPLVTALRDNPLAIAEGATGAPRQQGIGLGGIMLPEITLNTSAHGWVGLGAVGALAIHCYFTNTYNNKSISARFSDDDGVTWGGWETVMPYPSTSVYLSFNYEKAISSGGHYSLILPSGPVNAIQVKTSYSQLYGFCMAQIIEGV